MRSRAWALGCTVVALTATAFGGSAALAKAPCTRNGCPVATGDYKGPIFHLFVKTTRIEIVDTNSQGVQGTCQQRTGSTPFRDVPSLTPDWLISGKPPIIGRSSKYAKTTKTSSGGQTTERSLNLTVHFTTSRKANVTLRDHVVVTTPGGTSDCHGTATETVRFLSAA